MKTENNNTLNQDYEQWVLNQVCNHPRKDYCLDCTNCPARTGHDLAKHR
jgi:hypothetical protein